MAGDSNVHIQIKEMPYNPDDESISEEPLSSPFISETEMDEPPLVKTKDIIESFEKHMIKPPIAYKRQRKE